MKESFKKLSETWALFVAVADKESKEFVGWIGLKWMSQRARDAELGMIVKPGEWGKGYGTEMCEWVIQHAFKYLDAHRVSLWVSASNVRAVSIYKKT